MLADFKLVPILTEDYSLWWCDFPLWAHSQEHTQVCQHFPALWHKALHPVLSHWRAHFIIQDSVRVSVGTALIQLSHKRNNPPTVVTVPHSNDCNTSAHGTRDQVTSRPAATARISWHLSLEAKDCTLLSLINIIYIYILLILYIISINKYIYL